MPKKQPRDPGAPKRNLSPFLLYQHSMRETFKAQNPGMTFGQLAKYTSAMYAAMEPGEKEVWNKRAEADKVRYLSELSIYVPPPGFDAKGDGVMAVIPGRKKNGKQERDARAPKRNMSAYLLYQNAMRDQFKAENPGMSFGQLSKYTSHMYKNMTQEERAAWNARAEADRQRFEAEMTSYVPPPGHDAYGKVLDHYPKLKRSRKTTKDPASPKRARGSFVLFTFEHRPKVIAECPGIKFIDMGSELGRRWRALSPEQKKPYENLAEQDKERFRQETAQYKAKAHLVQNMGQNIVMKLEPVIS